MSTTYKEAGVDISEGEAAVERIKSHVKKTFTPNVLTDLGTFGAAFRFPVEDYRQPVLVSSTDGVGTKLKIAFLTGIHHTVGQDLVNHCVNDILTTGAVPLFFLDYIATGQMSAGTMEEIVQGFTKACIENGCSLIGGEMAEMPDFYREKEYDISGTVVGVVERSNLLESRRVKKGDILLGIPSSGLHTNGFSLARKVLLSNYSLDDHSDELGCKISEALLTIHRSYLNILKPYLDEPTLHAISHITGGGIVGNTRRLLPKGMDMQIYWDTWEIPPIFRMIQQIGNIPPEEMRHVFNQGIGLILVVSRESASAWLDRFRNRDEAVIEAGEIV